ncbi:MULTISPECIES: NAD(P)/FAD-dependent oxidoreductase [Bacillus]|uniref:FAD-dependent oxidoreductase n=1 Tax=Bacillus cereus TaxID=1396 RepID=A0AAN6B509_BACCE|nr:MULTISPECIES: tryptophan 7-halogenase [Bacillus]AXR17080.1 FAD-dependent oxidoreductase [Bacillus sp. CR71]AXR22774.1 FAD-dependent oxidoreductase [Bacillus sp. E25]KAB2446529.1 FAD-dependent oxidoreductase [Bacillus cereus]KAB2486775.1 FAD-dependent oxidoreductase [Bacillus cereus]OJE33635.1 FAD-dependent oxidoreductase [Bacillus thuringiensis]
MLSSSNYDIIIVGGGPAGVAAAISCIQKGLSVVIVEGEKFPRYRPGETLHPGIEPLLMKLGVWEKMKKIGLLRHKGNWIKWDSKLYFAPFGSDENGPWHGIQVWRANFDDILLKHAMSLGVKVIQPCHALRPILKENRVIGLVIPNNELRASYLIDATGRRQWLAQQLGLKIEKYSPQLIARFGYVQGKCPPRDDAPAIIADIKGWTWTAKVRPKVYQWTRLSVAKESLEKSWLPEEFQGLTPLGKLSGADVTWRATTQPGGPGYFLVGDAATVLDPSSSHGVLKAIMNGMMVGYLATKVLKENQNEESIIQSYNHWIYNWFIHDVEKLRELYSLWPNFENDYKNNVKSNI